MVSQDKIIGNAQHAINGSSPNSGSLKNLSNLESNGVVGQPHNKDNLTVESTDFPSEFHVTTYSDSEDVNPIPLKWGEMNPQERGPVLVSAHPESVNLRNAIGATGGPYSIYYALGVALNSIPKNHRPNYTNTYPPFDILPNPNWSKIVTFDPFGHLVPEIFSDYLTGGLDLRSTISATKANLIIPEIQQMIQKNLISIDGKVVKDAEGELHVCKAAIDPVWYLPGVAKKLGIEEDVLRRTIFEECGGMYPELVTRPDIKVFLPPIGGITVYIFGPVAYLKDPTKKLSVRVHDECNGSDVFGSDICTCRPYLTYGIAECVKNVQEDGAGLIIYYRKEGRALGEIVKYLVYNARKRQKSGDVASGYFKSTEPVAGTQDMRVQTLMPDVLLWLGVQKIDRFLSMSNMKYDAVIKAGIKVLERVELPLELQPKDSLVEMTAKIAAGYYTVGPVPTAEELTKVKGRTWDDIPH